MKSRLSFLSSEGNRGNMRSSLFLTTVLSLLCTASASTGPDYGAHPRFICTPIPVDADPACVGGPGMGGSGASVGPGPHGTPGAVGGGGPSTSGWWGMPEEAKATILHLRESLLKERETILEQRETIRELNAKLTLCEGFGRGSMTADDDHSGRTHHRLQGPALRPRHGVVGLRSSGHRAGNQPGHRGSNLLPDAPHHAAVGGHRSSAGHIGDNNNGDRKDKHTVTMTTAGERTSSPEQMDRMLQALKDRLGNLQKRNMSSAYSSSLKDLLQRKITTLEQQLHPAHPDTSALSSPEPHDDHEDDGGGHHDHDDGHDDSHPDDHGDDGHHEDMDHGDPHKDYDDLHSHDGDGDGNHDDSHHGNEDDGYGYVAQTEYRPHSNKLETLLSQLHLSGSNRKKAESPDSFQIGFPMRTNYMYSRVKRTLLNEIFALTLCLWIKGGTGPGLGTPFSYSVPGQANELVLIEWGNNPMELLIDDKAVTLPLSLSDEKWHHVCVTWSTREGHWEAYQDGVQRGSGDNLSPWHPIKPGGVFIIGQEQDTLGGRFDATQSFVGEISDLQMWSHVLSASDIHSLASCGSHLTGDVIAWSETELELHGGVSVYPSDPCH